MKKISALLALCFFLMAGTAMALPLNDRPVYINPIGGSGSERSLQQYLDETYGAYYSFDVEVQESAAIFVPSVVGPTSSSFLLLLELAGFKNENTFGIYSYSDPSKKLEIFAGPDSPYDSAAVTFAEGYVQMGKDTDTRIVDFGTAFGFYITTPQNNVFYSDDKRNPYGDAQAIILAWPGVPNEYIIAFEDLVYRNSDKDFNDLVVKASEVRPAPVPEPATMLLLGFGLIGLAAVGRRNFLKK